MEHNHGHERLAHVASDCQGHGGQQHNERRRDRDSKQQRGYDSSYSANRLKRVSSLILADQFDLDGFDRQRWSIGLQRVSWRSQNWHVGDSFLHRQRAYGINQLHIQRIGVRRSGKHLSAIHGRLSNDTSRLRRRWNDSSHAWMVSNSEYGLSASLSELR